MTNSNAHAPVGKATTVKKTFSRSTSVSTLIQADVSIIWALLTNAADFPRWNSTVISMEGNIQIGQKIKLKSTLAPERTFRIKVKEMIPDQKMVWGDAIGERTYSLEKTNDGVLFTMFEKISSMMFPLFASQLPSFDENFERYAADLKKEAEIIAKS